MGKRAKHKARQAIAELSLDDEIQTEAAYYARKCGITTEEALQIMEAANRPQRSSGALAGQSSP
ncbi:hypothetical protein [Mesorhizobium sp. B1-1-8]|uniref:hypothetical protein n=1 Tax=Mesorhizobium sp. B1-1-8 TaxID=2589976 RepID=UPI00112798A1|nr:hypothetical protein [Mesorhizobium sp. B1-1-8]UCI05170.1 hypothetical protein FJ974_14980 [Mesorhizobium sp. B1-1-8]